METKLVLAVGLLVVFLVFGTVVFLSVRNRFTGQLCGGADSVGCPFGFRCQITDDRELVGECVSLVGQATDWVYSLIPQLKPKKTYSCPGVEWVDCMPGPDSPKTECSQAFLDWAKSNCPGFRGAAY